VLVVFADSSGKRPIELPGPVIAVFNTSVLQYDPGQVSINEGQQAIIH